MSFWDRFRGKPKELSYAENENKPFSLAENEKINYSHDKNEKKLDDILTELAVLKALAMKHDQHLDVVNSSIDSRLTELMIRKRYIPSPKIAEVDKVIAESKTRQEAIDKLLSMGFSQATAYRKTESLAENEKETLSV